MASRLHFALTAALLLAASVAQAHKPSDSYLSLRARAGGLAARWDIALRDLDHAIGLDADGDGAITWGELRARHAAVAEYALSRLRVRSGGTACALSAPLHQVDRHSDGAYAVLSFDASCDSAGSIEVEYQLLFDLDRQHRGLLSFATDAGTRTFLFKPEQRRVSLTRDAPGSLATLATFWRDGVWHIWIGFDHVLFLLSLLLPSVLRREGGEWRVVQAFRPALFDTARVVTAFTGAHSVTLSLAALGTVVLPSRWVESGIAASVVLAALNNARPAFHEGRWIMAFAFGLLHGFGFASVLADPGLDRQSTVLALLGFNLGVESGQLAIVAVFLPLAFAVRESRMYRRVTLYGGSAAIAAVAAIWFVERCFDLRLLS